MTSRVLLVATMKIDLHESVLSALQSCKGNGHWEDIALRAGISQWTLEKIARGNTKNPGIQTIQSIARAMKEMKLFPAKSKAA